MGGGSTTPILRALLCLGLCWRPWDQVQAGVLPKPSIRADPGPIVPKGSPVTLWCQGSPQAEVYRLYKVGDSGLWEDEAPQASNTARFHFESLSSRHAGRYQCAYHSRNSWSGRSDPLALVVTGVYREPSLSAQPGSLVLLGDRLTLQCRSDAGFGRFTLTKDEGSTLPLRLDGQHSPDFPLGRVSHTRGGRYRCYAAHNISDAWSAPSAPLDILIAGMYQKPSLSAHPGTSVSWGENVTLQCRSEIVLDTFHLFKEGSLAPAQSLSLQDTTAPLQANFTLSPMTSAHNETYRCYTSQSTSPYVLSNPSDPLQLLISGPADTIRPSQNHSDPRNASPPEDYTVDNLVRMATAALILLSLGILLFQAQHGHGETQDMAMS
uniref:Ig-like domain-containing protein n=1 Tax=Sus scrofa TaxID=9823 RepID=A0A8D1GFG2_PIG